jgi:hypothetical protein
LTSEKLLTAVNKVLSDPIYTQKAQESGQILMDQQTMPLDRAVWWMEYAMRYPGMKHMRSPVHDLHWTQYFLLDVITFLIFIAIVVTGVFVTCCKCCFRRLLCKPPIEMTMKAEPKISDKKEAKIVNKKETNISTRKKK